MESEVVMEELKSKLKKYMIKEMGKICHTNHPTHKNTFYFCWSQAKFDTLMDIDRELGLNVFFKNKE